MGKRKKVMISKDCDQKYSGAIYISLPVPNPEIVKNIQDNGVLQKYLSTCEVIAKEEADVILKCAKAKYSSLWKLLLIVSAFIFLILGLLLGNKIGIKYGSTGLEAAPTEKTK